jgi:Kef-type K+ transport system membrane component KefB
VNAHLLTWGSLVLVSVLMVVAVAGKVLGAGWGAILGGLTRREALQLGVGMMSRGEVGLIVAAVGVMEGYVQADILPAIVSVMILTTILTPPTLRKLFPRQEASPVEERSLT